MRKWFPYLAVLFGILFLFDLSVVHYLPALAGSIDSTVHSIVMPLQTLAWSRVFLLIANFGGTVGIIAGMFVLMFVYKHRPDIIARMLFALLGNTISGEYLKDIVGRMRPPTLPWLTPITSGSFPSTHASESIVLYGFLAFLLYIHVRSPIRRFLAVGAPVLLILLIGLSRLALNYHYATDVIGGYFLGAFWLCLALSIPLYFEFYHRDIPNSESLLKPLL
jgi:undecaprenyl-diphosphatase